MHIVIPQKQTQQDHMKDKAFEGLKGTERLWKGISQKNISLAFIEFF